MEWRQEFKQSASSIIDETQVVKLTFKWCDGSQYQSKQQCRHVTLTQLH